MSPPHEPPSSARQDVSGDPTADAHNAGEDTVPVSAAARQSLQVSPDAPTSPDVQTAPASPEVPASEVPASEVPASPEAQDSAEVQDADEEVGEPRAVPLRPHRILLLLLVALNGWALDLATKVVAVGR